VPELEKGASNSFSAGSICELSKEEAERAWRVRGGKAGATAKDEEIGKRISAEAIRTVKTCGASPAANSPGNGGLRRFGVHADAAHHVVARGTDFHGAFGDVHVGEFLELVIHAGKFFFTYSAGL